MNGNRSPVPCYEVFVSGTNLLRHPSQNCGIGNQGKERVRNRNGRKKKNIENIENVKSITKTMYQNKNQGETLYSFWYINMNTEMSFSFAFFFLVDYNIREDRYLTIIKLYF